MKQPSAIAGEVLEVANAVLLLPCPVIDFSSEILVLPRSYNIFIYPTDQNLRESGLREGTEHSGSD